MRRTITLGLGDIAALLVFAAIGRHSHEEATGLRAVTATLGTAAPFIIGWLIGGTLLGAYRVRTTVTRAAITRGTARAWAVAFPIAVLVRALALGRLSPPSFYAVACTSALLLLLAWRVALVTLNGKQPLR